MSKPQDGLVSRYLNRPISRRVTRVLLQFSIHPTIWTMSIFVLPIVACAFFLRGDYSSIVIGTAIFQLYSILDGCDGEIARAKNLESKFGEWLDNFCDFLASIFFVLALGIGLRRGGEGVLCAALIIANESLLRKTSNVATANLSDSLYPRHRGMIAHSGLLSFGDTFVWWIMQLTKRDVAIFAFLLLAIAGCADWILHLWLAVAGASCILSGIAALRLRS